MEALLHSKGRQEDTGNDYLRLWIELVYETKKKFKGRFTKTLQNANLTHCSHPALWLAGLVSPTVRSATNFAHTFGLDVNKTLLYAGLVPVTEGTDPLTMSMLEPELADAIRSARKTISDKHLVYYLNECVARIKPPPFRFVWPLGEEE